MTNAAGPGAVVCAHPGVAQVFICSKQEQVFICWDLSDLGLKHLVEHILSLGCRAECGGVDVEDVSGSGRGHKVEGEDLCCSMGRRFN